MSVSDIIQIISIICTSLLSIVAIIISIVTLLQNNKMIFESNKPQITLFSKTIHFTSIHTYLILKNFGNSGATILDISYDDVVDNFFTKKPFQNISNTFIAPNQAFLYPLDFDTKKDLDTILNFKIKYKYLDKEYIEKCSVSLSHYKDICYLKTHNSKDLSELSEVLQEMTIQSI